MLAVPYAFVATHTNSPRLDALTFTMDSVAFSKTNFVLWNH